ncbi:hypothetical protein [Microbulbifer halophilus]
MGRVPAASTGPANGARLPWMAVMQTTHGAVVCHGAPYGTEY